MERIAGFELRRPASIAEAAAALAAAPGARLLAGGTDFVANLRRGIERPQVVIDLGAVAGFATIEHTGGELVLGAGVTLAVLSGDERVVQRVPALAEAARAVGGPGHRSAATLGGNLCLDTRCVFYNQSEWWRAANDYCLKRDGAVCHVAPQGRQCHAAFSGDLAPALLVHGAEVEVLASRGVRRFPLAELYREDGAAHLTIAPDEILARVFVPAAPPGLVSGYRKARARGAIDFPLAGVACALALQDGAPTTFRVALTGTNAQPFLLADTHELLGHPLDETAFARLGKLVQKQVSPMRTTVTRSHYRRLVAAVLAERLVRELADAAAPGNA